MTLVYVSLFLLFVVLVTYVFSRLLVWWLLRDRRDRVEKFLRKVGSDLLDGDLRLSYEVNGRECSRPMVVALTSQEFILNLEERAVSLYSDRVGYGIASGSWSGFDWSGVVTIRYCRAGFEG